MFVRLMNHKGSNLLRSVKLMPELSSTRPVYTESITSAPEGSALKINETEVVPVNNSKVFLEFGSAVQALMSSLNGGGSLADFTPTFARSVADLQISRKVEEILNDGCAVVREKGQFKYCKLDQAATSRILRALKEVNSFKDASLQIPQLMLVGLASQFENFLREVQITLYRMNPGSLNTGTPSLTYADLCAYQSLDEAKEKIIERHVEASGRSSIKDQIETLAKISSVKITDHICIDEIIEMFERRNVIVHANSLINDNYVRNCKELSNRGSVINKGDLAAVNRRYLKRAIDNLTVFAVLATHLIWVKQLPDQVAKAERMIMEISYDLIHQERFPSAIRLFEYCEKLLKGRYTDEQSRLMFLVNHANALALSERRDDAISKLESEDWNARPENFKICVESIKKNVKTVCEMLYKMGSAGPITESDFRDWPVFLHVRDEQEFAQCFEAVFGRSINQTGPLVTLSTS